MKQTARSAALAFVLSLMASVAFAQSHLRIGLGDDPDALDPSLSRFYTTRIVFAAICDKLFDIDEKSNIVPQLALGSETSADGKTVTITLRPGVKFHDGEPFNAEAAKYSLERHLNMKGSFRKPELSAVDSVEVTDPLTIKLNLKAPFSPLLAQLTDRAGMMVSPKAAEAAGDKFALHPVCAGPYKFVERVPQDRIVVEKFADYWNKDHVLIDKITYLPIVDSARLVCPARQHGQRTQGRQPAGQGRPGTPRLRALDRPRGPEPGRIQRRVHAGQSMGQPAEPVLPTGLPHPQARYRQGQGVDEGGRRHRPGVDRFHAGQQP